MYTKNGVGYHGATAVCSAAEEEPEFAKFYDCFLDVSFNAPNEPVIEDASEINIDEVILIFYLTYLLRS